MQSGLKWLHDNKEWVFSGCGLLVITGMFHLLKRLFGSPPVGLRIEVAFGFLTFGPKVSDQMLIFTVTNRAEKAMRIASIKVPLGKQGNMFFYDLDGERSLPCYIEPGTSLKFWTGLKELEGSLREQGIVGQRSLAAIVTDGVGVEYRSKKSVMLSV